MAISKKDITVNFTQSGPSGTSGTSGTSPTGASNLSDITIDVDKDWQSKYITNLGGLELGTAVSFTYDGTSARLNCGSSAPSDLKVACGAEKTIELEDVVYEDLQFQITSGKQPASSAPTWAALTTNTGEYGFDINEYQDLASNELSHGWKEGTVGHVHLHISIPDANSTGSDRFAQFTVYVAYVNASSVWTEVSLTSEQAIPNGSAALENFYLDLGDVDFDGLGIGTQVKTRIKRIAATGGVEYGSDVFIHQVGCHLEHDTLGSRQEVTK